jgi:AcrR family transcriptional regulator
MASIAQRAGVSTATLYRLYPDRSHLHLDALALGNKIHVDVLEEAPRHPHPFRNLVEMVHHFSLALLEPIFLQFHLSQQLILRADPETQARAIEIAVDGNQRFAQIWTKELDRLVSEGYLKAGRPRVMLHRMLGPIVARTLGWIGRGAGPYLPPNGWFEEAIKIIYEFCLIYATPKMNFHFSANNWAWVPNNFDKKKHFDSIHHAQFDHKMEHELPFLKDLKNSLATQGVPDSMDAFIWRELIRMLTKSNNRLDVANRQSRIVAAALCENQRLGFEKMSVAAVAKTAGVSTATVYRAFPSDLDLYEACHRLGVSFFIAWLSRDIDLANPIARMTGYIDLFVETFMDPRIENSMSMNESILADPEHNIAARAGVVTVENLHFHWHKRLIKLEKEGYLKEAPSWDMVHTLMGPIESGTFGQKIKTGVAAEPEGSWYEECWVIVDAFFQIYGTPYFHAMRKKMNWDADLAAHQKREP